MAWHSPRRVFARNAKDDFAVEKRSSLWLRSMIMVTVIPTVVDNAVAGILESLPIMKMEEVEEIAGDAGVVAAETLMTMIQVTGVVVVTTTTKREDTGILRTDEKNSHHQEAGVRAVVDAAEGEEEGDEEKISNNNANGHQHRPWILGQPILPVGTPTRILCVSNSCDLWN